MNISRYISLHSVEESLEDSVPQNREKVRKSRPNFFADMDGDEFIERFRILKSTCLLLLTKIKGKIESETNRNWALSPEEQLLLALRFYASGSFLIAVGDFCGVSVPTASRCVRKVSHAIASLSREYIKFGNSDEVITDFYNISKFPKVMGAIDCTHIRIQSPGGNKAEIYRNRKGYFSLNVQAVCDANLIIQDVVARWPGSAHDSNVFNNSRLKYRWESGEFKNNNLLGDSGYKVTSFMMTPLQQPISEAEKLYNESQIRTRNVVERFFGVWKRRFPILSMGMRIHIETAKVVIIACAVLHNIAVKEKERIPPIDLNFQPEYFEDIIEENDIVSANYNRYDATTRNFLISNYFEKL